MLLPSSLFPAVTSQALPHLMSEMGWAELVLAQLKAQIKADSFWALGGVSGR